MKMRIYMKMNVLTTKFIMSYLILIMKFDENAYLYKNLRIDEENYILMFDVDNEIWYLKKMRIDIKKLTYIDEEIVKLIFDVDNTNLILDNNA